jgi:hypothetical protein
MESRVIPVADSQLETSAPRDGQQKYVVNSTALENAAVLQTHAGTIISVSNANNLDTAKTAALSRSDMVYGMHPKFLRYNVWDHEQTDTNDTILSPYCLADWTEQAKPLPSVPTYELSNIEAMRTIKDHPTLFKIITPINIDLFEQMLLNHPNQPFVHSGC